MLVEVKHELVDTNKDVGAMTPSEVVRRAGRSVGSEPSRAQERTCKERGARPAAHGQLPTLLQLDQMGRASSEAVRRCREHARDSVWSAL